MATSSSGWQLRVNRMFWLHPFPAGNHLLNYASVLTSTGDAICYMLTAVSMICLWYVCSMQRWELRNGKTQKRNRVWFVARFRSKILLLELHVACLFHYWVDLIIAWLLSCTVCKRFACNVTHRSSIASCWYRIIVVFVNVHFVKAYIHPALTPQLRY